MKKIIQLFGWGDSLACLTEDGKVYIRENQTRYVAPNTEENSMSFGYTKLIKNFWEELPEEVNYE